MKGQLVTITKTILLRLSHAPGVRITQARMERHHAQGSFQLKQLLGTAYAFVLIATCSVNMCIPVRASTPMPDDLQLVPSDCLPTHASWYSVQRWGHYPPSPLNWCAGRDDVLYYRSGTFGTNRIIIDDSAVDYTQASAPTNGSGEDTGPWPRYSSNDIWLEIQLDTNQTGYVDLILRGITNQYRPYWQLLSNPIVALQPWAFGEIRTNSPVTNTLYYAPVPKEKPMSFFRAVGGDNIAQIISSSDAVEPDVGGNGGQDGNFVVFLKDLNTNDVIVWYSMSGTALPGLDYSNYPGTFDAARGVGSVVVGAYQREATVYVHPFYDTNIDYDEPAFFTLILTNDYVVKPSNSMAIVFVRDDNGTSNLFSLVATNIPNPVGIDYSPAQHGLILPINYIDNVPTFGLLDTNAALSAWSTIGGINAGNEVRIGTVKTTTNGLIAGDLLFGNGDPGGIGWLSADASSNILNWITITNEPNLIQALYVDESGSWSNDVFAVSGADAALSGTNLNVWRIHFRTNAQLLASIPAQHLEGLLTVPTNSTYGPIAGTLLTGDETLGLTYSIDTNGVVTPYLLGIFPDEFRLVPPSNDLYCVSLDLYNPSEILKIPRTALTSHVGDIMIEQSGETGNLLPELFFVHWNGTNFESHGIRLNNSHFFEKSTFAPIDLRPIP